MFDQSRGPSLKIRKLLLLCTNIQFTGDKNANTILVFLKKPQLRLALNLKKNLQSRFVCKIN